MNKLSKKNDFMTKDRREKHIEFPTGLLNVKVVKDSKGQEFVRIDLYADEGFRVLDFTGKDSEQGQAIGTGSFVAIAIKPNP